MSEVTKEDLVALTTKMVENTAAQTKASVAMATMNAHLETILGRGCVPGDERNAATEKALRGEIKGVHERVDETDKRLYGMKYMSSFFAAAGGIGLAVASYLEHPIKLADIFKNLGGGS